MDLIRGGEGADTDQMFQFARLMKQCHILFYVFGFPSFESAPL